MSEDDHECAKDQDSSHVATVVDESSDDTYSRQEKQTITKSLYGMLVENVINSSPDS